jgi:hypothetical protein
VIADTFSCLSRKDDAPGLVGKEATVSDLAYYSLFDDQAIFDCLLNLPCLSSFIFISFLFLFLYRISDTIRELPHQRCVH